MSAPQACPLSGDGRWASDILQAIARIDAAEAVYAREAEEGLRSDPERRLSRILSQELDHSRSLPLQTQEQRDAVMFLLWRIDQGFDLVDFETSIKELGFGLDPWRRLDA
jgi:hypothetical protein